AGRAHDTGDVEGRDEMAAAGNAITTLSEEATAEMRAIGAEVTEAWIEEVTARGLDGAALVDDVRAMVEAAMAGEG
ncbi:MAG: C4-dicarboxylate ABC transporter, partial [Paracoccaceae bacterium]|nr:C4-dicarboxylate ABC transporter [Paracoccaceae bacterium]